MKKNNLNSNIHTNQKLRYAIFLVTLIGVMYLVRVVFTARVATVGAQIRELENQKNQLREEISLLQSEVAGLSSLSTIESKAKNELHMVSIANNVTYITISKELSSLAQN